MNDPAALQKGSVSKIMSPMLLPPVAYRLSMSLSASAGVSMVSDPIMFCGLIRTSLCCVSGFINSVLNPMPPLPIGSGGVLPRVDSPIKITFSVSGVISLFSLLNVND